MTKMKTIPQFKNESAEDRFWSTHDTTAYFNMRKPLSIDFPNLKPTTKTITLRLPVNLLVSIKKIANKRDVPYQSLIKVFLDEKAKEEYPLTKVR